MEAAQILIENGADVNRLTHEKLEQRYALHYTALKGNIKLTRLLLDNGATTKMPREGRYLVTFRKITLCIFIF